MTTKIIALASLIALSACTTIQGTVRDKATGEPISSANVTVDRTSTTTNAFGSFRMSGSFIPGSTMFINAPGYNIYTRSIKSVHEIVDIDLTRKQP